MTQPTAQPTAQPMTPALDDEHQPISFPRARTVRLPGRGDCFVRIAPTPPDAPDAPTLLLLHGWTATADINWGTAYGVLSEKYGLVAPDLHGHGRGPRRRRRFRLEDCAHDVAALAEELGLESAVVVGYSMGGTVAQLLWRHHPSLVDSMVLCATAATFRESRREQARFAGLWAAALAARALPRRWLRSIGRRLVEEHVKSVPGEWVVGEMRRHEPLRLLQAGRELGVFDSRRWLGSVDVPVSCVVTARDAVVSPRRQLELAELVGAGTTGKVVEVSGTHTVCLRHPQKWLPPLVEAVDAVAA
ncbi:MAG TPA: alpha/beta hydrolase [Acidimicrobiaceae bacterium]|nr:alpha/beta hydrolase [Acidimicrobiaceae bacterium]